MEAFMMFCSLAPVINDYLDSAWRFSLRAESRLQRRRR
jgi:hypothetical protein